MAHDLALSSADGIFGSHNVLLQFSRMWVKEDRVALHRPDVTPLIAESIVEAYRQGFVGVARDVSLLGRPWDLDLDRVSLGPVHLWHGARDQGVNKNTALDIARRLPSCRATICLDEGHVSLIINHGSEILRALVEDRKH